MTISASSNLSEADIERAMQDAAMYENQDRQQKEYMELHNEAESLAFQTEQALVKERKSLTKERKSEIKEKLSNLKHQLKHMKPEKMTPQDEQSLRSAVDELYRVADEVLQEPQQ